MKSTFQHIISLFLAFLVLVSTQSYSINTHYCGNILVDKAIMKPAKKCAMHDMQSHSNHENEMQKDDCCSDEVEWIDGQDQLKIQSTDFELPNLVFVEAFLHAFLFNISIVKEKKSPSYEDPPPLYQKDLQAFYQVYLI
jgi:hypothetical protein